MRLYFVSRNDVKIAEVLDLVARREARDPIGLQVQPVGRDVQEILSPDLHEVVRSKVLEAYRQLQQPCLVEHGGLFFTGTDAFPGVFGRIIWRSLQERMCGVLRDSDSRDAEARACLGYCDGKTIRVFEGITRGQVAHASRGIYNPSSWDPIFIPEGGTETYGEMGADKKRATSPLLRAWDRFVDAVQDEWRAGGRGP